MITKPSELLIAAKALIREPEHWTTGALARNATNDEVGYSHPEAVCFCSYGAIGKVANDNGIEYYDNPMFNPIEAAAKQLGSSGNAACYNDTHTHAEVMQLWDKAIEIAIRTENNRS